MYKLKWVPGWTRLEPVLMSSNELILEQGYKIPSHILLLIKNLVELS